MKKTLDLSALTLYRGVHQPDSTYCVMELSAYLAGEPWSDAPKCVSPVISAFMRSWNDGLNDTDRQMLKPYSVKVLGTHTTDADETTRAWMCADWFVRTCVPAFLRLTPPLIGHADALVSLPELKDAISARSAQDKLDAAWDAAWAAARAKLRPTVEELQKSALQLLDRMIAVGKTDVKLAVKVVGL